jgi:hypothetical protein
MSSAMQFGPDQMAQDDQRTDDPLPPLNCEIPPMIAQSQAAFRRDLPQLLKERPGQYVAYHGDTRVGFADSDAVLCQQCLARGLTWDQFVVRSIEPEELPLETDVWLGV